MSSSNTFSHTPVQVEPINTQYRRIVTPLPVPESLPIINKIYAKESRSMHGQLPLVWDRAEDFQIFDQWGNIWLDFTSTIFVANAGHGNKKIRSALKQLLDKPLMHTYTYPSKERANYLEYLIEQTPVQFEKAYLISSGTEATETALKLMRMYGKKIGKRKGGVICFDGAFHGRTMGAQMMTGDASAKDWIGYQDPNIHHLPFPYPWEVSDEQVHDFFNENIETLLKQKSLDSNKDLCGIMMEAFQGWGAIFYPKDFVHQVFKYAREKEILVAFDEMQSGFGRTGKLFGYMHYGIEPDILCCGKGVSSGMPLSIVMGTEEVMDLPDVGSMSSTHSANPISCLAGHENLRAILDEGLIENSKNLGNLLHQELNSIKDEFDSHCRHIFGKGLLAALIFLDNTGKPLSSLCDKISEKAFHRGLLVVHTGRESIKIAPPLSISKDALLEGTSVLRECIKDSIKEVND